MTAMPLAPISAAAASGVASSPGTTRSFQSVLDVTRARLENAPLRAASAQGLPPQALHAVQSVMNAQRQLDEVLAQAQAGKTFKPAELLALQTKAYAATQEIELASKVVEKGTSAVKQVLQTQL